MDDEAEESDPITGMSGLIDFRDFVNSHLWGGDPLDQVIREMQSYVGSLSVDDCKALIRVFAPGYPGI